MLTIPDCESAVKAWVTALFVQFSIPTAIYFELPQSPSFPCIAISQVSGIMEGDDTPLYLPLIQFDVWGNKSNKRETVTVKNHLIAAIESLPSGVPMGEDATSGWGVVTSDIWNPDGNSGQARYAVSAEFAIAAA